MKKFNLQFGGGLGIQYNYFLNIKFGVFLKKNLLFKAHVFILVEN